MPSIAVTEFTLASSSAMSGRAILRDRAARRTIRNPVKSTSQIIVENPRIAWAILGSMLLHASLVAVFSLGLHRTPPPRPVEQTGFAASLVVRISGAQEKEVRSEPGRAPKPQVPPRETMVVERAVPAFVAPVDESSVSDNEAIAFSADAGQGEGDVNGYRGVSVTETSFQRMFPRDFSKVLLQYPDFLRATQINRPPQPVNIVMPRYPARELAERSYAWIIMAFFIDERGNVVSAIPVDGSEGYENFREQVAATMRESTFTAGERFGLPVKSFVFQLIEFRPQDTVTEPPPAVEPAIAAP
jgi:hypothetical protein